MTRLIRYCPHAPLEAALALGWRLVADLDDTHHGAYTAGLDEWTGPEPAPWPHELNVIR
jgi:hypothetical protein